MLESENKGFQDLALFFLDLAERSKNEPLEYLLEAMLGADIPLVPEDEIEDEEPPALLSDPGFVSPFKEYYFGKDRFQSHRSEYLSFLSSLTLFVSTLREYRRGQPVGLSDLVSYVEGHEKNGLMITDSSPFVNASQAVQLMTAHKAKGQEFERVFVLSCQNDVWAGKGVANILSFPLNLPIAPSGDSLDDQLRLFYVALTRAKRYLVLTSYSAEDSGKESLPLQFLEGSLERSSREVTVSLPEPAEVLAASWAGFHAKPIITEEAALLIPQLENYKMSVTHLNNFLNVTKGPKVFMEENLLRFPHPRSASSSYGSAFHELIRLIYVYLKKTGEVPTQEVAEAWLEAELLKQRLNEEDFRIYQGKGKDAVRALYEYRIHEFRPEHQIESNFNHQEVHIGDAHITGKIDKMVKIDGHEWAVHDFKTGKAHDNWVTGGPHDKIKLHGYRRQLLFYKLLIENSRDYTGKYEVKHGVLEFLEPKDGILFALGLEIDREETERLARLIEVVFQKVQNLDFPDVTGYSQDVQGIRQFEDDLLEGRV
jgi:DNA helicase-2/ATP-dependent DNA helicase PcrA